MRSRKLLATPLVSLLLAASLTALPACTVEVPLGAGAGQGEADEQPADAASDDAASDDPLAGIDAGSNVVALSRSAAEMWLLAGGSLVGAPDDALDLPGLTEGVASVGDGGASSVDKLTTIKPDLVLLDADAPAYEELRTALGEAGLPAFEVDVDSLADYEVVMGELTGATGRSDLFEQNVTAVKTKVDEVIERAAQEGRGSYVALRVSADGARALGADDFVCAMLDDMGMEAATGAGLDPDAPTAAAVAEAAPDWVFVVYEGDAAAAQRAYEATFVSDPAWAESTAAKAGHVVVLPQGLFEHVPCKRWSEAYAYLSQVSHGAWA